jgi:hypothetical protein
MEDKGEAEQETKIEDSKVAAFDKYNIAILKGFMMIFKNQVMRKRLAFVVIQTRRYASSKEGIVAWLF